MFDEVVYLVDTCQTTLKHPDFALKLDRAVQAIVAESFSIQYVLSRPDPELMPFTMVVRTGEVRPVFTDEHATDTSTLFDAIVTLPGRYGELWESPRARHVLIIHTLGDRPASQASMMDALKALDTLVHMGVSTYFAHAEVHEWVPGGVFRPTPEPVVNGDLVAEVVSGGVSIRNMAATEDYGAIWRYLSVEQRATMLDIEEDGKLLWENLELAQSLESLGLLVYEEESNLYWISETGKRLIEYAHSLDAESEAS